VKIHIKKRKKRKEKKASVKSPLPRIGYDVRTPNGEVPPERAIS